MKITSILAIVLCFAFILSLALTGCKKNNDPYFMNSSEYDSLISGIAGGNGCGLLFSRGEIIRKVPEENLLDALHEEILKYGE